MPVHTQLREGILRIVVDGDYTPAELRRVGGGALDETTGRVAIILDLSGAAGMRIRSPEERARTTGFLSEHQDRISHLALVAPGDVAYGLMRIVSVVHAGSGIRIEAFRSGLEARAWIEGEARRPPQAG